ncbi:MAG: immune inhibitor A [Chloroflexi bacterium]|nr:immune inhibitor A [Chloroflexota bacterium]
MVPHRLLTTALSLVLVMNLWAPTAIACVCCPASGPSAAAPTASPANLQVGRPAAGVPASVRLAPAAADDPATQAQIYLESLGYTVRSVRLFEETRAQVYMDMVSGAFDENGKAQVVQGWYALAQAYPEATYLWNALVYQKRYYIIFEALARDMRDWVDGRLRAEDLHYTVLVYDAQIGDYVRDKDFVRKNFAGAQAGRGQSIGALPQLKFPDLWIIYRDDFSDDLSGWDDTETSAGAAGYANDQYRVAVKTANTVYWASTPGNLRDFALAVQARQSSGDVRNPYGIIFGYQDADNLLAFFVTAEGRYTILQKAAGAWNQIQPWTATDALKQGNLVNLLRVEVQNDEVRAYANGRSLTAVTVAGLAKGQVGLAAATYDAPPTEVYFDNVALFGTGADWKGDPGTGGEPTHALQAVRRETVPAGAREALAALYQAAEAVPAYDLHDLAVRMEGLVPVTPRTLGQEPQYSVGDTETFYVSKKGKRVQVEATLVYETAHARAWIEEGTQISTADVKAATDTFENEIYGKDRSFFGSEWTPGVDQDVHIHLFNGDIPNVGGYFSSSNEYVKDAYRYSNQKEMFFMNAAGNEPGTSAYLATLAHEFQHMIHWTNKQGDDLWVDEGCADLAKYLMGIDPSDRAIAFGRYPDLQLNAFDQGLETRTPHYGKSFLFMAYFLGRFGREMTQQIASGSGRGTTSFDQVLESQGFTFDDIFADWVIANYVNDATLDPAYAYPTDVDATRPRLAQAHETYPVQEHTDVHQYAADYIKLEGQGNLRIDFTGSTMVPIGPGQAHGGDKAWWFGWGDMLNPKLTREFDLTNASNPKLTAWMWYDTVNGTGSKMSGFWSVSTDGGVTWDQVTSELDGRSGGGDEAKWVQGTIDLSSYAGQKVQVRFEALSYLGEPAPGFAIDDIAITAIGYQHGAETSDDGWVGEGFVRVTPLLPQAWTVRVIKMDGDRATGVRWMSLDSSNQGSITIDGLGGNKTAVLVIAARTPFASAWAPYEYRVTQE